VMGVPGPAIVVPDHSSAGIKPPLLIAFGGRDCDCEGGMRVAEPTFRPKEFWEFESNREEENSEVIFEENEGFKVLRSMDADGIGWPSGESKFSLLLVTWEPYWCKGCGEWEAPKCWRISIPAWPLYLAILSVKLQSLQLLHESWILRLQLNCRIVK
jgi:hypothetical protein